VREIRLYDSVSGQLVPVSAGDAIRVEVRTSPSGSEGAVDIGSTRPLVLFSFLERFLQREGFGTKFLFDSPSDEDTMYELSEDLGNTLELSEDFDRVEASEATEPVNTEMSLHEVPRSDVDRWVNVCFGGGRDGTEWHHIPRGERVTLTDALKEFGHPAVAMYLLGTHYSLPLGDASIGLQTGSRHVQRLRDVIRTLVPDQPSPPDMHHHVEAFRDALADDLNTPLAFVVLFEWVLDAERRNGGVGDGDLRVMLEVLELDDLATPVGA
jgi:hypothetical protein